MKRALFRLSIIVLLILVPMMASIVLADPPGPPSPGGDPTGSGGIPVGGPVGGPIGDGISILLTLGVAYGCYKIYEVWKSKAEVKNEDKVF